MRSALIALLGLILGFVLGFAVSQLLATSARLPPLSAQEAPPARDVLAAFVAAGLPIEDIRSGEPRDRDSPLPNSYDDRLLFTLPGLPDGGGGQVFTCRTAANCSAIRAYFELFPGLVGPYVYQSRDGRAVVQLNSALTPDEAARFEQVIQTFDEERPTAAAFALDVPPAVPLTLPVSTSAPPPAPAPLSTAAVALLSTRATPTTEPTVAPTPPSPPSAQQPIRFEGSGDAVVELQKWPGVALVQMQHNGGQTFIVWSYGAGNEQQELLASTIGPYAGNKLLDSLRSYQTERLQIQADGAWIITILPIEAAQPIAVPNVLEGSGDNVLRLTSQADILTIDASRARDFLALYSVGDSSFGPTLLAAEIAPYQGQALVPNGAEYLSINASGPYRIEISAR